MAPRVELRPLEAEDRDRILAWRNSPDVRAYMYTDHVIAPDEHAAWFANIDGDESRRYWIITADEEQMRQLRERRARPPGFYSRARWAQPEQQSGKAQGAQP